VDEEIPSTIDDGTIGSVELRVSVGASAARLLVVDREVCGAWMTGPAMLIVLVTLDVGEGGAIVIHLAWVIQYDLDERHLRLLTDD
jgi:hypothetical protein